MAGLNAQTAAQFQQYAAQQHPGNTFYIHMYYMATFMETCYKYVSIK